MCEWKPKLDPLRAKPRKTSIFYMASLYLTQLKFGNVDVLTAYFGEVFLTKIAVFRGVRYLGHGGLSRGIVDAQAEPYVLYSPRIAMKPLATTV